MEEIFINMHNKTNVHELLSLCSVESLACFSLSCDCYHRLRRFERHWPWAQFTLAARSGCISEISKAKGVTSDREKKAKRSKGCCPTEGSVSH